MWYTHPDMRRGDILFNVARVPFDFCLLVAAGIVVYLLRVRVLDAWWPVLFGPQLPLGRFLWLILGVSTLFILVYAVSGLYTMQIRMSRVQEVMRIGVASSAAIMVVIVVIFLRQELFNSRFLVVGYWATAMASVLIGRMVLRSVRQGLMSRYGAGAQRVLLIGTDQVAEHLETAITNNTGLGYRIVKHLANPDLDEVIRSVEHPGVDEIILANPDYPADRVVSLVDFCHEHHITFTFVPNIHQTLTTHWDVDAIGRTPVVTLRRTSLNGWGRVFKRAVDMTGAAGAILVLSPLFAVIAVAIKWETWGPVFVRLPRMSRNRQFQLLKFRSMIAVDADGSAESLKASLAGRNERHDGPLFKMRDDPRVTRVGRFLRRARLDELPQFFNVLWGDIALVGPRPHQPDEIARYEKHHRKVLAIKAGATGLAQVSGSSDLPFEEEVALDTFYIENWSLAMDLRILFRTMMKMFIDHSAV